MAASSRLGRQITEIVTVLDRADAPAALIGGLALASHGVVRATQDVDFLTGAGLAEALPHTTPFGALKVIGLEGLIAFKLQGFVNDPRRTRNLEDIQATADPFAALDDLMVVVEALCPRWPEREGFGPMHDLRL